MTSPQTQARKDLAAIVDEAMTGWQTFAYLPENALPPFAIVGPGADWITFDGVPFAGRRIGLAVVLVVGQGSNDVKADALDEAVETAIEAISASDDFVVLRVNQPGQFPANGKVHMGVAIEVSTEV